MSSAFSFVIQHSAIQSLLGFVIFFKLDIADSYLINKDGEVIPFICLGILKYKRYYCFLFTYVKEDSAKFDARGLSNFDKRQCAIKSKQILPISTKNVLVNFGSGLS